MGDPAKIEFDVDEQYENEKGVFKVISIHRGQMLIRWANGEEISTDIELQRRIAERRDWEHNHKAEAAGKASAKSASARKKSVFDGFAATDFKKSAARTTWRSRSQLGSAVAQKIDTNRFKFNSWAFGHKPEIHVQDIKHHGGPTATDYQAKFFVRVDPKALYYGFRVTRPDNTDAASADWDALREWLTQQENEQMLHTIAVNDNLTVCNLTNPSSGTLMASEDGGWRTDQGGRKARKETLAMFIDGAPETGPFDLELTVTIAQSDAVACGRDIAANIAQLFTRLLPLYQAAVIH
jgi:hypothetical protein